MTLPTVEVVEIHYWAVLIRDEFDPEGKELTKRHENKESAEKQVKSLISKKLATKHVTTTISE